MGKYDDLKLPRLPAEHKEGGDAYQERIDLKKAAIEAKTPTELAARYRTVRKGQERDPQAIEALLDEAGIYLSKEELEGLVKARNLELAAVEQLLIDAYEAEDLSSLKLADGASVSTQVEPYVVVQDKAALRDWLAASGHKELLDTLVPTWQTLNALLKERLAEGEEPPPGTSAFLKHKIVLRAGR